MNPWQEKVREFQIAIGSPRSPAKPEIRDAALRARLILEEAVETIVGLIGSDAAREMLRDVHLSAGWDEPDIVDAVDGICDLIYVALGTAESIGIDLDSYLAEVHRSNMEKVGAPRDAGGKLTKPHGWTGPRIALLLNIDQIPKGTE